MGRGGLGEAPVKAVVKFEGVRCMEPRRSAAGDGVCEGGGGLLLGQAGEELA